MDFNNKSKIIDNTDYLEPIIMQNTCNNIITSDNLESDKLLTYYFVFGESFCVGECEFMVGNICCLVEIVVTDNPKVTEIH